MRTSAPITTTDLLKFAGLAFVFVDHIGLFFVPGDDWWRVVGRAAAPIFFFLIGFARTTSVPLTWLAFGAALTALDAYASDDRGDVTLNILFNFALIRFVAPWVEAQLARRKWAMAALALFCAAMIPVAALVFEYGAEGWLWALFGLAAREAIAQQTRSARLQRNLVAAFCVAAYLVAETRDFDFDFVQTAALVALMSALTLVLIGFRREAAPFQLPPATGRVLNWIGRHSLEIYAVSLFLMQLAGHLLEVEGGGEDDDAA